MSAELQAAEVVAAFSQYEAHPIGGMESLALSIPVVGYDTAGIGDLVADGLVRGVPPTATPSEAAMALDEVMRAGTSRRPDATDVAITTWDESAARVSAIYASVLQAARPSHPASRVPL